MIDSQTRKGGRRLFCTHDEKFKRGLIMDGGRKMAGKNRFAAITITLCLTFMFSFFTAGPEIKAFASETAPDILITEIMPKSRSTDDAYEYIELYNNSGSNIDIKDYKFAYPNIDITTHRIIPPEGVIVLCTRSTTTLKDFNSFYGTSLDSQQFMALPLSVDALSSQSDEDVILSDDDGNVVVCAGYDKDDIETGKSITYKYPEDGFYMDLLGRKQSPTPGTVSNDQIPYGGVDVTGITLNKSALTMEIGQTYKLKAAITPSTATNKSVKWSSNNSSIATVSTDGVITAKSLGVAMITAETVDGGYTASCTVVVTKIPVKSVKLDRTSIEMDKGEAVVLTAEISPDTATNKSVTWSSSNNRVASVDSNGMVLAKSKGTAVIRVTTLDGGYTASCTVTVDDDDKYIHVTGVSLNKTTITMDVDSAVVLEAKVKPSNADDKRVNWSSSNTNVAVVNQNGVVYAKDTGRATITVKTVDGGYTASCRVTVTDEHDDHREVTGVRLDRFLLLMEKGQSEKLTATVFPPGASNKDVTWSSDNTSVAKVDDNGNVKAVDRGVAVITVKTDYGNHADRCIVIVMDDFKWRKEIFSIRLNKKTLRLNEGDIKKLNVIFTPGNAAKKDIVWSTSDSKVAVVSDDGKVTAVKKGKAVITAATKDGRYKDSCIVYVEKVSEKGRGKNKFKFHGRWFR